MRNFEEHFAGHDGLPLFERAWLCDEPRGVIVHVHGLIEHSGRYANMAEAVAAEGFAVYAMDLRGHGRSAGPRCDVKSFNDYLLDLDIFFRRVRERQPEKPIFLMGNSMGGLIVTQWAIRRKTAVAGMILSGPLLALADEMFPHLRYLAPWASRIVPWLRFPRIPIASLSRSPEALASYRQDPLFFLGRFTVRVAAEIQAAIERLPGEAAHLHLPLLILHGGRDQICGLSGSRMLHERARSADKTLHIYPGMYHEVFDEPEREQVLADLTNWLNCHVAAGGRAACPESPRG